jgi:hypothetical protein
MDKKMTHQVRKALHLGLQQIADHLVENGVSLQVAFKDLEVRPTMENIKGVFRQIAKAKYGIESTEELTIKQIDEVWVDITNTLSLNTGTLFEFPSQETTQAYQDSYGK